VISRIALPWFFGLCAQRFSFCRLPQVSLAGVLIDRGAREHLTITP
jgi:hypothetical protein